MAISQERKTNPLARLIKPRKAKASSAELKLFEAMQAGKAVGDKMWQEAAKTHTWLHFTRHSPYNKIDMTIIERGEALYFASYHPSNAAAAMATQLPAPLQVHRCLFARWHRRLLRRL